MSFEATRWAWSQKELSPTQKFILLNLADRANGNNFCYPSVPCICTDTGYCRAAVQRALGELENKRLLRREFRLNAPTVYHLQITVSDEATPPTKEATPPTKEATPPTKEATPPTKEATPAYEVGTNLPTNLPNNLPNNLPTNLPASSVVGGGDLVFSKLFSKAEREKMVKILEAVAEIGVKQQMLDVLAAAVQDGKVKNKLSYLRGLAKSHAGGLFDPLPGFYVAQRRGEALEGNQAAGFTNQRQVAELEAELNGLIRINGQGLLDAQIAKKQQKLAELKAAKPV